MSFVVWNSFPEIWFSWAVDAFMIFASFMNCQPHMQCLRIGNNQKLHDNKLRLCDGWVMILIYERCPKKSCEKSTHSCSKPAAEHVEWSMKCLEYLINYFCKSFSKVFETFLIFKASFKLYSQNFYINTLIYWKFHKLFKNLPIFLINFLKIFSIDLKFL